MNRFHSYSLAVTLFALLPLGCQFGPMALRTSHTRYNQALQSTGEEELLLNLVRLLYREPPEFLEVGAVSAQFVFDQSADVSGRLNENIGAQRGNPSSLSIGGTAGYAERPTISYAPLSGDDFVQRLLSPISIETVMLLTHSGWNIDRVLRLTVQELNGLDNARAASGPTPEIAPEYKAFAEATAYLRGMQARRQVYLEVETRQSDISDPMPGNKLTAEAMVAAASSGARFRTHDEGQTYVLTRDSNALVLRFVNGGIRSADTTALRDLLNLEPNRSNYDLVVARKNSGGSINANGKRTNLAIDTRSLLGIMFYLAQGIQVPDDHREKNLVTNTVDANGPFDWSTMLGDLFTVHTSRLPPRNASAAVRYKGHWFYIRDDDQQSKSTFALLSQLFTLQAGSAKGAQPLLTLPVGG